jgi:hypothetical protein
MKAIEPSSSAYSCVEVNRALGWKHTVDTAPRAAVDHRDADEAQQRDSAQQQPVEMVVEPSFEHR